MKPRQGQARLDRLRKYRNRTMPDQSLAFMANQFKREVAGPFKQLEQAGQVWQQLVPEALVSRTRLIRVFRGVLHVGVDSSATMYELDRLMRDGLERQITTSIKGRAIQRIALRLDAGASQTPAERDSE